MSSRMDRLAEVPPPFISESATLTDAFELARSAHRGQERKDPGSPFVVHPILVAERLHAHGYREEVVTAALLHDVLERSDLTVGDVATRFGPTVASLVARLTDEPGWSDFAAGKDAQRQEVAGANREIKAIFAADRTSNARELTRLVLTHGRAAGERDKVEPEVRLQLWRADLEMLEERCPGLDLLPELRSSVEAFAAAVGTLPGRTGPALV